MYTVASFVEMGLKMSITIESYKRFSDSSVWEAQREYYDTEGIDAWAGDVPFYVTSNPFIAHSYANMIVRFIQDWIATHPDATAHPFYILELGTGPGQFSYYLLKTLSDIQEKLRLKSIQFRYVMSDFTEKNIRFWESHGRLKPYIEKGILDFAKLDLEHDASLTLCKSGETLGPGTLSNPLIIIANYIFDTLKNDIFTVENGKLSESQVSMTTDNDNMVDGKPKDWEKVKVEHKALEITDSYYNDPNYDTVLADYKNGLTESHFLFPIATLDAMKRLKAISNGKMLVLSSDKGYSTVEEQDELEYPELAFHGSFSVMVNFDAIARYFKNNGGDAMLQIQREGITSAVFVNGIHFSDLPETTLALEQYIEGFSPGDYFVLHESLCDNPGKAKLEDMASLLSMSHWDPYSFDQVSERICDLLDEKKDPDPDTIEYIAKNMKKIADNFYFVPGVEDTYCNIGLFFHEAEKYEEAIPYYILSLKYFGDEHEVLFNLGICHYELEDYDSALDYFKRSLNADPKSKDAKEWIRNTEKELT